MADQENEIRPEGVPAGEDTKTRKTVRLRPQAPASSPSQLADPLSGHSAAPAELHVLDDTQTRKTIKLKPIHAPAGIPVTPAPAPAPVMPKPAAPAPAPVMPKPAAPAPAPVMPKPAAPAPAPVAPAPVSSGEDTSTRKATVLRPHAVAAVPETKKEVGAQTIAIATPASAAAASASKGEDLSSRTVRIQRPVRPAAPPKPAVPSAGPAASKPVIPPVPPVPAPGAAPKPAVAAQSVPKPVAASKAPEPAPESKKAYIPLAADSISDQEESFDEENAKENPGPAKWFVALAALCGILLFATALITTLHYLQFEQRLNYTHLVPGLPRAK